MRSSQVMVSFVCCRMFSVFKFEEFYVIVATSCSTRCLFTILLFLFSSLLVQVFNTFFIRRGTKAKHKKNEHKSVYTYALHVCSSRRMWAFGLNLFVQLCMKSAFWSERYIGQCDSKHLRKVQRKGTKMREIYQTGNNYNKNRSQWHLRLNVWIVQAYRRRERRSYTCMRRRTAIWWSYDWSCRCWCKLCVRMIQCRKKRGLSWWLFLSIWICGYVQSVAWLPLCSHSKSCLSL